MVKKSNFFTRNQRAPGTHCSGRHEPIRRSGFEFFRTQGFERQAVVDEDLVGPLTCGRRTHRDPFLYGD